MNKSKEKADVISVDQVHYSQLRKSPPLRFSSDLALKLVSIHNGGDITKVALNLQDLKQTIDVTVPKTESIPFEGFFHGENIFPPHFKVDIRSILSIGPGKYIPTELCLYLLLRPERIESVEIDKNSVEEAKEMVSKNGLSNIINILEGDLFAPVHGNKYDLIVSNIARMPMPPNATCSTRDYGGTDGWELLDKIIKKSPEYLNRGGFLSLLSFDFQGVFNRTSNSIPTLVERLNDRNFCIVNAISYIRKVRPGGATHYSLEHITSIYPEAIFRDAEGNTISRTGISATVEKGLYFYDYVITAKLS